MKNQETGRQISAKSGAWSLGAAVLAAVAATLCCVGPLALVALGIGGVWAGKLTALEPYRPVFIALTAVFLCLAFFGAYRSRGGESCSPQGSCRLPASRRLTRVALWIVSPPLLALLAAPYVGAHLHGHFLNCGGTAGGSTTAGSADCCAVPASADSEGKAEKTQKATTGPIDPAREAVFEVESLQCPAVKGVGCGSMLWPVLTQIDRVNGAARSYSNWTGTRLRISVANASDRDAVAERVRQLLASDERHPRALSGTDFTQALRKEEWYSASQLIDLSSYEFRTIAKRRLQAFADSEKLDAAQREKLAKMVDQLWDTSAEALDGPGTEAGAYGQYWRARLNRFVGAFAERARDVLSAEQIKQLLRRYQPPGTSPANG